MLPVGYADPYSSSTLIVFAYFFLDAFTPAEAGAVACYN
jgi:hypothetical protein